MIAPQNAHGTVRTLLAAALTLFLLFSCSADDRDEAAPPAPTEAPVTTAQAGEVVSDAMLVASQALYLAIATGASDRQVATDNGRLSLAWSEDADFLSGAGVYEIELDRYAIADDDPFALAYHGYLLTGTITLRSETGARTRLAVDLETDHADPELYPARIVELDLSGFADAEESATVGYVRINGQEFTFAELDEAF